MIKNPHFMANLARLTKAAKAALGRPVRVLFAYDEEAEPSFRWAVEIEGAGTTPRFPSDSGIGAVDAAATFFEDLEKKG